MKVLTLAILVAISSISTSAQEPFNGLVTRRDGSGVRARVYVIGRDKQTYADRRGRFGLTDIEADDTLRLVWRRDTVDVAVEGRQSLSITWPETGFSFEAREDQELANFGYGYVNRRESTDFSSGISGDRLRATGCNNLLDAIVALYPGLRYINGELCLRTQNSINSGSAVLVLCDGMEVRPELINIHDVRNVEILTGPNMYGFRGVHGVVLITTLSAEDVLNRPTR